MPKATAAIVCLLALLAAGCGGGGGGSGSGSSSSTTALPATPTTSTAPADPGKETIGAFAAAARAGNARAMWNLLSIETRRRLGPTLARFLAGAARELQEGVGSFGSFRAVVSERVTAGFG